MRRLGILPVLVAALLASTSAPAHAGPAVKLTKVDGTQGVTVIASRAGTRTLYISQQDGAIWSLRDGKRSSTPVLDLRDRVSQDGGERGFLGLTFSPDGKVMYVHYSDRNGDTEVESYTMRAGRADPRTRHEILHVEQPQPNHNGGQLAFGPDGYLYLGLGDGGNEGDVGPGHAPGGNGQSLGTLLGKILRLDPNGSTSLAPADNPFVGVADDRPEIWSYGLRNPWRFSFDAKTGDLWIGDVGQDKYEEIDHVPATNGRDAGKGVNFGWNHYEGDHRYQGTALAGTVEPVYEISHDTGACAVIGGYVYRGKKSPSLDGTYFFSDNCDGTIRMLVSDGNGGVTMRDAGVGIPAVSTFGQANNRTLYVASLTDGVYRIDGA
jgi:glucose/arabinose dehydrogenase